MYAGRCLSSFTLLGANEHRGIVKGSSFLGAPPMTQKSPSTTHSGRNNVVNRCANVNIAASAVTGLTAAKVVCYEGRFRVFEVDRAFEIHHVSNTHIHTESPTKGTTAVSTEDAVGSHEKTPDTCLSGQLRSLFCCLIPRIACIHMCPVSSQM